MEKSWKTWKRCIALVLAAAIVLSAGNFGFVAHVHAVEDEPGTKLSTLIAENYDLPEALEDILRSGMLKAEKQITYEQPEEGIVEVNSDEKTVTAQTSNGWKPVSAKIKVGDEVKEIVTLNDGVGSYTYAGNAFAVVVTYELYVEVAAEEQLALLNAAYYLAQDVATVGCLRDGAVELVLSTLTSEMEELKDVEGITLNGTTAVDLINQLATEGIELPALTLGGKTTLLSFLPIADSIDDAAALLADKNDGDGMLALYSVLKKYASLSGLELVDKHSAELMNALKGNYENIHALAYDDYGLTYVLKVLEKYNSDAVAAIADAKAQLEEAGADLAEAETLIAQLREAEAFLAQAKSLLGEYHSAKEQIAAAREALAEYSAAMEKLNEGISLINQYYDAKAQLEDKADEVAQAEEVLAARKEAIVYIDEMASSTMSGIDRAKALLALNPNNTTLKNAIDLYEMDPETVAQLEQGVEDYYAALEQLETAKNEAKEQLKEYGIELSFTDRNADVKILNDAKAELTAQANAALEPYGATVDTAEAKLNEAEAEMDAAVQKVIDDNGLSAEGVTIDNIDEYVAQQEAKLSEAKAEADAELKKLDPTASIDNAEAFIENAKKELADATAYIANAETVLLPQLAEVEDALDTLITTLQKFSSKAQPAYECESWNTVDMDILRDDLTGANYSTLSGLVEKLEEPKLYTENDVKTSLFVASKEIQYNMSMFDVSIEVIVYRLDGTVGSNNLIEAEKLTGKVTLEKGADLAAIKAAIEAANVVPTVDLTYYQAPEVTTLPETLTEDITYTVEYYPNTYTFKIMDDQTELTSGTVYHGYLLRLPAYTGTEDQVYEYYVGSKVYSQNEIVPVTGDVTFERAQGKPRTGIAIKDILTNNMTGGMTSNAGNYGLSAEASAILSSAAVRSHKVALRAPSAADVTVEFVGSEITATSYSSDLAGLYWKPVAVDFVGDNGKVVDTAAMINGKAAITDKNYAKANVRYELVLETAALSNSQILELLNLPNVLVQEYVSQKNAIAILDAKYSALGQLDSSKVGMLVAATKDMDPEIYNAALSIQQNCMDEENLKLYNLLTGYRADGMAYYYRNFTEFDKQTALLTDALEVLWGDAENQEALLDVMYEYADILNMTKEEIDGYVEPLGQLLEALRNMTLFAPNENIDVENDALPELVNAIVAAQGKTTAYSSVSEAPKLYISISKDAPDYISWNIEIYVDGKLMIPATAPTAITFRLDKSTNSYTLTADDMNAIDNMVEAAFDEINASLGNNLNDIFYTITPGGEIPSAGTVLSETTTFSMNYTAKEFKVYVEGTADQIISLGTTLKVNLPAGSSALLYEYVIDGKTVPAGSYTFTIEQIARLFTDGSYTVNREVTKLNPVGDKLQNVVNSMNGNVAVDLVTTENPDGSYSYEMNMKIPTSIMGDPSGMNQMGMALFSGYTYIEMNSKVLLDGTKMYAQTLLDAVMNSGLSGKTIQNIANNNGGLLFSCELTLGASAEDANKVTTDLNIYLEGESEELDQAAQALTRFENYVTITCADGGIIMDLTLPEKAYQAYLAAMLVLDQRDLKNINDVDGKVALGYILDVMDPVLSDETLTLDTFINTLNLLGYGMDASMFEPYFDQMVDVFNALVWNYDEDGVATTLTGRESVIDLLKEKLGSIGGMVADEDIHVNITLNVTNLKTDYEAAFVDISADGILNKAGVTKDLAGKSFAGKGAIVLLSDIGSAENPVALKYNDFTVIDLNGYTIYGSVTASEGTVYITDSSLAATSEGSVTGELTGNVRVTAGTYAQDVTANLMDGYSQDSNGSVKNDYYTITEDAQGNYTVTLNAAAVKRSNLPDVKTLALDMLLDLALNSYDKGAMKIEGYKIYDIALNNVVDSYASANKVDKLLDDIINGNADHGSWFDVAELAELYDVLVADLTDFDNIANGEYLAKYEIETAPWELSVFVDGEHLSGAVGALSGKYEKRTVTIVLSEDNVSESVKDLAAELDKVLKVESDLDMSQIKDGSSIRVDANYKTSNIIIDFTGDDSYVVALGTLLADVVKNNTALLEGLESYENYGTTNRLKYAIDACTVSDVLTALANVDSGYDFSKLGSLGNTYKEVLRVAGAVIRKLELQDKGSRTLGSMETGEYAVYVLDKENISLTKTKQNIFRDYDITVGVKVPLASVTVLLCNACQHADAEKIDAKDATCTEDGNIEYWYCEACRTCFLDETCTRQIAKEDTVIAATGHAYDVAWDWADDYSWAIATFTCTNDGCTASSGYAKDEVIDSSVTENATCDKEGTKTYTASVVYDGKTYSDTKTESVDKLSHSYKTAPTEWEWTKTETGYAVTAVFKCEACESDVRVEAVVTSDTDGAGCTEAGKTTYTATVKDSAGTEYTDTKEESITASGHDAAYVGYKAPTCTEPGNLEHWYCGDCGKYFADEDCTIELSTVVIDATDHAYEVEWTWADDYSSAIAYFTCKNDCDTYFGSLTDNEIESDETDKATCKKEGLVVHTASVVFKGVTYSNTANEIIDKVPHTYTGAPADWSWTETADGYTAKATFVCEVCQEPVVIEATVTSQTTDASCTTDGKITYTATVQNSSGIDYTATKEDLITAPGHSYNVTWDWTADFSGAEATFTCANCDEVNDVVTAEVTTNGNGIYVATATYNGKVYVDIATDEHDLVLEGWTWEADYSKATAHIVCDSCGEELDITVVSTSVTTDATCTAKGETVYTVELTLNGTKHTDSKTVEIPEKNHAPAYTAKKDPTCLENGNVEYWYCANCDKYYADELCTEELTDVVIEATGHSYGAPTWSWAVDYAQAVAKFTCGDCSDVALVEGTSQSATTAPDCTNEGKTVYTVSVTFGGENYTDTKEVVIPATGHTYKLEGWTWSADNSSATASFSCENCNSKPTQTAYSNSQTTDATCTEDGKTVYTVALIFNDESYTDTKEVVIPAAHKLAYVAKKDATCTEDGNVEHWYCDACGKHFADELCTEELTNVVISATGHSYGAPTWAWAADKSSAVAKFTCSNCSGTDFAEADSQSVTTAPGCTADGKTVYTVSVTFEGENYTATEEVVLPATGHAYKLEGWTWADDYSSATAKLVCDNNGCIENATAQFINKVTHAPTCTENGKNVYTAVVTVDGTTYTDTAEQIIVPTGHDYELEGWTWADDMSTADAKFVCETCGDVHTATVNVQSVTVNATCTADGKTTYTASVTLDGSTYTDVKEQRIPATGHTYEKLSWNWSVDHTSATVTIRCSCGSTQNVKAIVTTKTTEPTYNADGKTVYTATAIYNGQTFTDTYTVTLKYKLSIDSVAVNTNNKLVGVKITNDGYIYLDLQPSGVTVEELLAQLKVQYQADKLTLTLTNSKEGAGLVCNGSVLSITASNKDGHSVTKNYVIIILGDVNGNGKIEVADTYLIAATRVGTSTVQLNKFALLAADVNLNGGLDVADASRNANKIVFWDSYKTGL